jgi:galactokinase
MAMQLTMSQWTELFAAAPNADLKNWLESNYGPDQRRQKDRLARFRDLLSRATQEPVFDDSRAAVVGRTPCRARVFGGHTDFRGCGGCLINMAGNLEMMYVAQPRDDRRIVLRNMSPEYAASEFGLDDWDVKPHQKIECAEDWDHWCMDIEQRKKQEVRARLERQGRSSDPQFNAEWTRFRETNWQEFVKGLVAFLQTDLVDGSYRLKAKLRGFTALFWSEIPVGCGLSSSSAVVMSAAKFLDALCGIGFSDDDMVKLGYCEHYNGTKGGMNDHASIIKGRAGKILLMRSFPEMVHGVSPFPDGVSLFLVDSGVKRSQAPELSDKLQREGVKDAAVVLARTGIGYVLASLWIRQHFPEYREVLRPNPEITNDNNGLLREFNVGGDIGFDSEEERAREIYRVLQSMPIRVSRSALQRHLPEFQRELEALFVTHPEPAGGYALRGMALYGFAENERTVTFMRYGSAGLFERMQELMRIAHDGDRVSQWDAVKGQRVAFEFPVTDRDLDEWIRDPVSNPVWRKPGYFERSIEPVDQLCDLIAERFKEVATGRIAGAGLGGAVTVLAKSAAVREIREFLSSKGYSSIPPLTPSQGASTVG